MVRLSTLRSKDYQTTHNVYNISMRDRLLRPIATRLNGCYYDILNWVELGKVEKLNGIYLEQLRRQAQRIAEAAREIERLQDLLITSNNYPR